MIARRASRDIQEQTDAHDSRARRQADARGVPAEIMLPRILLVVATVLLSLIGLVMGFSASSIEAISLGGDVYSYVGKQAAIMAVGGVLAFVIAKFVPYDTWLHGPWLMFAFAGVVVLLGAVSVMGSEALGATRWIYVFGFSLQPSELAKIVLVIMAAKILYEYRSEMRTFLQTVVMVTCLVVLPLGFLFVTQSDMGTAIIVLMGAFAVMWVGEVPLRVILLLFAAVVLAGVVGLVGYRVDRIQSWLDPWSDRYGAGYQVIRSFYAFAEGGIFGVGLGNSREKFQYLSEAETDFIFAVIGEELGLIGALVVIALFLAVLYAGLRIAHRAPDAFGTMLAGGLTVMLVGQAFLNMACVTGLFPITGKPLPFISSGGSSILASMIIVGLILSVSVGSNVLTPYERRRNDLNVIRVDRPERPFAGEGRTAEARRASSGGLSLAGLSRASRRNRDNGNAIDLSGSSRAEGRANPASEDDEHSSARSERRRRMEERARNRDERGRR